MKAKRIIAAVLAFFALASFAGCKSEKKEPVTPTLTEASETEVSETQTDAADETADSSAKSQTNSSDENKFPLYYIGQLCSTWNHWTLHKERSSSYEKKAPENNLIINSDFEFDGHENPVLSITYENDNRDNANGSVQCKYSYNSDGTIKNIEFVDSYATSKSYEYDSEKRLIKTVTISRDKLFEAKTTYYTYNSAGLLISEKCYSAGSKLVESKDFEYNTAGKIVKSTIDEAETSTQCITEYEYDNQENCVLEKYFDLKRHATGKKELKYDKNGFVIYEKETDFENNIVHENYYTRDKYENPILLKQYLTIDGSRTLSAEFQYSYDYSQAEIKANIKKIQYDDGGIYIYDSTRIYKYHKTIPSEMYFLNYICEYD